MNNLWQNCSSGESNGLCIQQNSLQKEVMEQILPSLQLPQASVFQNCSLRMKRRLQGAAARKKEQVKLPPSLFSMDTSQERKREKEAILANSLSLVLSPTLCQLLLLTFHAT